MATCRLLLTLACNRKWHAGRVATAYYSMRPTNDVMFGRMYHHIKWFCHEIFGGGGTIGRNRARWAHVWWLLSERVLAFLSSPSFHFGSRVTRVSWSAIVIDAGVRGPFSSQVSFSRVLCFVATQEVRMKVLLYGPSLGWRVH